MRLSKIPASGIFRSSANYSSQRVHPEVRKQNFMVFVTPRIAYDPVSSSTQMTAFPAQSLPRLDIQNRPRNTQSSADSNRLLSHCARRNKAQIPGMIQAYLRIVNSTKGTLLASRAEIADCFESVSSACWAGALSTQVALSRSSPATPFVP